VPARADKKMSTVDGRELAMLAAAFILPPLAFLLNLQMSYTLVPWACSTGREFVLHLVSIGALLLASSGGLIAWLGWQRGGRDSSEQQQSRAPRDHFISVMGILMSGMFALVILAQWIPNFILSPCQR
jgi:hypothetical protein